MAVVLSADMGEDISAFEGLVKKTASLFYGRVGLEFEDMCQELRLKVVKARRAYDPTRSRMTEHAYVYACLANFVKDLKRDAARRHSLRVTHIEDDPPPESFFAVQHEQIYGAIEDGTFILPVTITPPERDVLLLLVLNYSQPEIAMRLGVERAVVGKRVRCLREKLADWRPSPGPLAGEMPEVAERAAVGTQTAVAA